MMVLNGAQKLLESNRVRLFNSNLGYSNPLALSTREPYTAFTYKSVIPFCLTFYEVGYLGLVGCLLNSLHVNFIWRGPREQCSLP